MFNLGFFFFFYANKYNSRFLITAKCLIKVHRWCIDNMQQFSVTYKNMIPTWCTRQSPIIPLIYGWWTVLQETAVLVKQAQFDGCPFSERLWGLKPNVWHHWFGPRSFQLGSGEVQWGESPEESSSCLAIFKAPGRVRGHMHSVVVVGGN